MDDFLSDILVFEQHTRLLETNKLREERVAKLVAHHDDACLRVESLMERNKMLNNKLETEGKD